MARVSRLTVAPRACRVGSAGAGLRRSGNTINIKLNEFSIADEFALKFNSLVTLSVGNSVN